MVVSLVVENRLYPDQEGRKGSEEGMPENLSVPLEGDRDFEELCGSEGAQLAPKE